MTSLDAMHGWLAGLRSIVGDRLSVSKSDREQHGRDPGHPDGAAPDAVAYGTMRANVMGLTVVLPDGTTVRTGSRTRKSSAGYDLTALFVGAEGTLGVMTEVALRLHPIPERIVAGVVAFETLSAALDRAVTILQLAIPIARMELLDPVQMRACRLYSGSNYAELPTLFVEFHGAPASVTEQVEQVEEVVASFGGALYWADGADKRSHLWKARHDAYWGAMALRPGARMLTTDVCVPISGLARCITDTRADFDSRGLTAPILGHVGDGNFHCFILYDEHDPAECNSALAANAALVARALAAGGTCTGEHGVGTGKQDFLLAEHGDGVALMRTLKLAVDPHGLFNPGKIFSVFAPAA